MKLILTCVLALAIVFLLYIIVGFSVDYMDALQRLEGL